MLNTLPKETISSKLRAVLDFAKTQHTRIMKLEAELMGVKLAFADSMTLRYIKQRSVSLVKPSQVEPSQVEPALMGKPSYSQAVKGHQALVLVATFTSSIKPGDRIPLAGVEELLGSSGGGPVPASVRQKENNIFILVLGEKLNLSLNFLSNLIHRRVMLKSCSTARKQEIGPWLVILSLANEGRIKIQGENGKKLMLGSPSSLKRQFTCLQVNLRHSRIASASLAEVTVENTLDVVLIQEPFAKGMLSRSIINIPPGYVAFHLLSKEHAYGAAVLVKLSLAKACRATNRSCDNHIAAVDLHTAQGTFRFISVYLRPTIYNIAKQLYSTFFLKLSLSSFPVLAHPRRSRSRWKRGWLRSVRRPLQEVIATHTRFHKMN
ncbi:hypothetical protein GHT06_017128 [Daphnia sinensis]|uniref:Uncharacterized protein n=1 Tax=Daphnia sinensis TaxID=1820382 RepID=A0AAD5KR56_9CRUS|nr:hypothetical protein GHT06_017128 [Daphnia sinensis]